ncbi:Glycosyl hydrolase family 81, C-terminal domain [Dillenia turbinata]|uniref:glucan endo-1,3-beta-D-glucosidase n=1 Tax=Dillenia turbinata TaxID=194707 RepID=A0AAN8VEU1_9MAGN
MSLVVGLLYFFLRRLAYLLSISVTKPAERNFPHVHSFVLPDPSHFSANLLYSPLPTNSFFQNFAVNNGNESEYLHPYFIKPSLSSLSLSYPSIFCNSSITYQVFSPDLTISTQDKNPDQHPKISSFSDLSVTLDFPSTNLQFFLVRGSPYLTCLVKGKSEVLISSIVTIESMSFNSILTKYTIKLNNKQKWLIYASSPIKFSKNDKFSITSDAFSGIIRIAISPDSGSAFESILDQHSTAYPVFGEATFTNLFTLEYRWEKQGFGDLLMLAHPLQLELLSSAENDKVVILKDFKYNSMDGDLVGVVGDSWILKSKPVPITWNSIQGIDKKHFPRIISSLDNDTKNLNLTATMSIKSSYFFGKAIARAARLELVAEEVSHPVVIPHILKFLKTSIQPWLDSTFSGNGFLYESKWRGLVTKLGSNDPLADFGFGMYNDHHFHLGYFLYAIAVIAKQDPDWGATYKPQAYSLMSDFMSQNPNFKYPVLRNFDLWKLHSWAGGIPEFPDGRNQESTSEAVNAYYAASLLGLAYGDSEVFELGSSLTSFEIMSAQKWWHVEENSELYAKDFVKENRVVGILWNSKRESRLWWASAELRECRLAIQVMPVTPITEALFSDVGYVKELVEWTSPALKRKDVDEGWKGFYYAMEAIYDWESALGKILDLTGFDDGNSLTNLLWWVYSRKH